MLQIVLLILIPLAHTCIPPNRRNVDHPIPKLHEGAPLDGNIQIRNIMQDELDQLLVLVLPQPLNEAMARQRLSKLVRSQSVLRKRVVEEACDGDFRCAELFLLFREVGTAYETDGAGSSQVV